MTERSGFEATLHGRWLALRQAFAGPLVAYPRPLLNPDKSLAVIWSAKCASMTTVVWFLHSLGLMEAFLASDLRPHRFRRRVYVGSDLYARARGKLVDDYFIAQVIRDPYSRAVSSYRHALSTGYADSELALFDPTLDRRRGFSFSRFLDYLDTLELADANAHHRLQRHPLGQFKQLDRVINISRQDLFTELNRLEAERDMPVTDFAAMTWLRDFEQRRKARLPFPAGEDASTIPLDREAAEGARPWPSTNQFLTPAVRRRIERLYAADFQAFAAHL